jgi:glycosyltransferase involved in cell wall biosynthesis
MIDALAAAGWTAGMARGRACRRLPHRPLGGAGPTGVGGGADRDEAARLTPLLSALAAEPTGSGPFEVIVVDDSSTDSTAALARAAGAVVLRRAPPPGWTGKSWACWEGARASRGEVRVFLDADTEPAPRFVARLAGAAAACDGLVTGGRDMFLVLKCLRAEEDQPVSGDCGRPVRDATVVVLLPVSCVCMIIRRWPMRAGRPGRWCRCAFSTRS